MFLLACAFFVLQTRPGLCADMQNIHADTEEADHLRGEDVAEDHDEDEEDGEDDEDDEGAQSSVLEEDEFDDQDPKSDEESEDPPDVTDSGEAPGDFGMHRRRGVLDEGEEPTTPEPAPLDEESTTSTTPYPMGIIGPDPMAVDPDHTQELGPVKSWPTGAQQKWGGIIASFPMPGKGVQSISECGGRRRHGRRRDSCRKSFRRRRRTEGMYSSRAGEECADRRRVDFRRRICEAYGSRRRRSRRRDQSLMRRRRSRRRRFEDVAARHSKPQGDRRRRYHEDRKSVV